MYCIIVEREIAKTNNIEVSNSEANGHNSELEAFAEARNLVAKDKTIIGFRIISMTYHINKSYIVKSGTIIENPELLKGE